MPTPKKDEEKKAFITRCNTYMHKENKSRDEKRDPAQINAICHSIWEKHRKQQGAIKRNMKLQAKIKMKKLGNALAISGTLLKPGIFTGLDGEPTNYSKDFIKRVNANIIGRPIGFAHEISPDPLTFDIKQGETVGFWTGVKKNGNVKVEGYVFHPDAIRYYNEHPNLGLSMEAEVITTFNESLGVEDAQDGLITGGVLIDDPACPTCQVTSAREINLARGKEEKMGNKDDATKKPFIEHVSDKDLAEPTFGGFLAWVGDQLKGAGAPDGIITRVKDALSKGIKEPLKVPAGESFVIQLGKALNVKDLEKFTAFMETHKDKSLEERMSLWEQETKTPPPPENPSDREKELEAELAKNKTELEKVRKIQNLELDEEINGLVGKIKEYEDGFESNKFLEHIENPVLRKKMLQNYLKVLKTHARPIKLQIGNDTAQKKVLEVSKSMFGENMTFEDVFPEFKKRDK